jgi:4-hydroxy-tetrahydrodipicolinate reductase
VKGRQPVANILISGASGNMGKAFVATCFKDDALHLVACTSRKFEGHNIYEALGLTGNSPTGSSPIAYAALEDAIANSPEPIEVGVELTHPSVIFENTITLIEHGIAPIIGGTGLSPDEEMEIDQALKKKQLPGMLVPNFSVGAVLMMRFAAEASRYFDHAEIVEYHHNQKADAPSGTSLRTAELMRNARPTGFGKTNMKDKEVLAGARGGSTEAHIHIHSVRLPGLVAHQEVLLGSQGQMLTLRHDSYNRECFMPGIALCCKSILGLPPGLHLGLESVM